MGAVKEMVSDSNVGYATDRTDRYTVAGAETIVAVLRKRNSGFHQKNASNLAEILLLLLALDYVVLEGLNLKSVAKNCFAAKTADEAQSYLDGSQLQYQDN